MKKTLKYLTCSLLIFSFSASALPLDTSTPATIKSFNYIEKNGFPVLTVKFDTTSGIQEASVTHDWFREPIMLAYSLNKKVRVKITSSRVVAFGIHEEDNF